MKNYKVMHQKVTVMKKVYGVDSYQTKVNMTWHWHQDNSDKWEFADDENTKGLLFSENKKKWYVKYNK